MTALLVVLRVIHICSSIYWVGAAVMLAAFVLPSAKATGPEGGKFMQYLTGPSRYPISMIVSSLLASISGLTLFGMTHGFRAGILQTGFGVSLSLGSLVGIAALVHGFAVQGRAAGQMGKLTQEIQSSGKPPSAEQLAQLQAMQAKLAKGENLGAVLLVLSALSMAAARAL